MIFRQLLDRDTSTWTYLLADATTREAVIVDPVREQHDRDRELIDELGLTLRHVLETHVHADHVTGADLLRRRYGCAVVVSRASGCEPRGAGAGAGGADILVDHGDRVAFGRLYLEALSTPGHTAGCVTYVLSGRAMAFTGDALMIRGCGRTDFQGGDAATLFRSVTEQIFSLPDHTLLYPGHDYRGRTVTTVGEEKAHNPRLGGARKVEDFVRIMAELKLSYPARMDEAVPANLRCGAPPREAPHG